MKLTSWRLMLERKKTSMREMTALMAYLLRVKYVVNQPWPKVWSPARVSFEIVMHIETPYLG